MFTFSLYPMPLFPRQSRRGRSENLPVRINFSTASSREGRQILAHLAEERLIAGGTVVIAEALHWLGGEIRKEQRRVVSAYTTLGKLPLIRGRLELLCGAHAPVLSQFTMPDEKPSVRGWIERNVRE